MSVKIIGAASAAEVEVDSLSKALRVIPYTTAGMPQFGSMTWDGISGVPVSIIPTTLTSGTCYFACRNLGARMAYLVSLELITSFTGTAAATRSIFEFGRFNGATHTGGTAVTPSPMSTAQGASTITDIRFAPGGLTGTGVTYGPPIGNVAVMSQPTAGEVYTLSASVAGFEMAPNEGFYVRAAGTVIAGAALNGHMLWAEVG